MSELLSPLEIEIMRRNARLLRVEVEEEAVAELARDHEGLGRLDGRFGTSHRLLTMKMP